MALNVIRYFGRKVGVLRHPFRVHWRKDGVMTNEKVIKVLKNYAKKLDHIVPGEMSEDLKSLPLSRVGRPAFEGHLAYMCQTAIELVRDGRTEKAMRWLGFIQASLYILGYFTIDDLKDHSRPDQ